MDYQPKLYIGIGSKTCYFTLRETYLHYGRGEVLNGVFTGTVEERSFHHFNLSQEPAEAFAKAQEMAFKMDLPLTSTLESIQIELNTIHRTTQEMLDRMKEESARNHIRWESERIASMEEFLANRQYPIGRYKGREYAAAPLSYINWIVNASFEPESPLIRVAAEIRALHPELILPLPHPTNTVGEPGQRLRFTATVIRTGYYDREAFSGYGMERVYLTTMVTPDGTCLLCKSTVFNPPVGEVLDFKATVKDFSEYNGQVQTVIQRITVLEPK